MSDRAFTVGHSARSADELATILHDAGVGRLADVRSVPRSRRQPWFAAEAMAAWLPRAGIDYVGLPALGGFRRSPRGETRNAGWEHPSFRAYADYMSSPEFAAGLACLQDLAGERPTTVMCAEAPWWRCHRRLIADALLVRGWEVVHLGIGRAPRPHELTGFAVVDAGGGLSYPPPQLSMGEPEPGGGS